MDSGCTTASFFRTARLNFLLLNSNSTMSVECTILHGIYECATQLVTASSTDVVCNMCCLSLCTHVLSVIAHGCAPGVHMPGWPTIMPGWPTITLVWVGTPCASQHYQQRKVHYVVDLRQAVEAPHDTCQAILHGQFTVQLVRRQGSLVTRFANVALLDDVTKLFKFHWIRACGRPVCRHLIDILSRSSFAACLAARCRL